MLSCAQAEEVAPSWGAEMAVEIVRVVFACQARSVVQQTLCLCPGTLVLVLQLYLLSNHSPTSTFTPFFGLTPQPLATL